MRVPVSVPSVRAIVDSWDGARVVDVPLSSLSERDLLALGSRDALMELARRASDVPSGVLFSP